MSKMEPNKQQFERIARWLDGQAVALSGSEQALAEDLLRLEARTGVLLDVSLPPQALAAARRRMLAEVSGRRRRALRWGGAMVAAAAAVLLLAFLQPSDRMDGGIGAAPLLLADVSESPGPSEIDALDKEIEDLEAQLITSTLPGPQEVLLEPVLQDSDAPWMDELDVDLEG